MKDRALAAFAWFSIIGLLLGAIAAATAIVLLVVNATRERQPRPDRDESASAPSEQHSSSTAGEGDGSSAAPDDAGAPPENAAPNAVSDGGQPRPDCGTPPQDGPFDRVADVAAENPRSVDAIQIYPAAKTLARELEPESVLRFISANRVVRGRVDITRDRIGFVFEYQRFGPTGQETGLVEVVAGCGRLHAKQQHNAAIYRHNQYDPVSDPGCSMERAWLAAVQTGLPRDAEVRMIYRDDDIMKHGSPIVWSITQDGQPNRRREVHGQSCRLYRTFQSGAPVIVETYARDAGQP